MNSDVSYLEDCKVPCLPGRTHCLHRAVCGMAITPELQHFNDQHFDGPNKLHVCCHCWMTAGQDADGVFHFPVENQRSRGGAREPPTEPDSLNAIRLEFIEQVEHEKRIHEVECDRLAGEIASKHEAGVQLATQLIDALNERDTLRTEMADLVKAAKAVVERRTTRLDELRATLIRVGKLHSEHWY